MYQFRVKPVARGLKKKPVKKKEEKSASVSLVESVESENLWRP